MSKEGYSSRKKWNTGKTGLKIATVEQKRVDADERHEEYLLLLEEKNRVLKQLKKKDPKQISLEKKEKGFSLYVSGANDKFTDRKDREQRQKSRVKKSPNKHSERRSKTAREKRLQDIPVTYFNHHYLELGQQAGHKADHRAKTAPEKERRNWLVESLDIQTHSGHKLKLKAPEILTGHYEDDFETYMSESFHGHSESESDSYVSDSDTGTESISEEEFLQMERKPGGRVVRPQGDGKKDISSEAARYNFSKQRRQQGIEGRGGEKVTHSVKKLHESRETNASIQENIAGADSESEWQSCSSLELEDSLSIGASGSDNSGSHGSLAGELTSDDSLTDQSLSFRIEPYRTMNTTFTVESEDSSLSEIEEDLRMQDGGLEPPRAANHNRKVLFKPKDAVVLDFGAKKETKERQLSARRKPDSYGEYKETPSRNPTPHSKPVQSSSSARGGSSILKNKTPTPVRGQRKEDVIMNAATSKKARPLSANRKSAQVDALDSTQQTKAVIEAMRQENERMEREKARKSVQSAPGRGETRPLTSPFAPIKQSQHRPTSAVLNGNDRSKPVKASPEEKKERKENVRKIGTQLASLDLDCNLDEIVSKVLQLDSMGQRKLLHALKTIEDGARASVDLQSHSTKKPAPSAKKSEVGKVHVLVEILSNWGHPDRVGLTEMQVFDEKKARIDIDPGEVLVEEEPAGDIGGIFNGKFKTVKERNMVYWENFNDEPIEFTVMVPNTSRDPNFGISMIKLWNYNKSLNDLSVGARDMRVSVDGSVVFEGELDKGCGNQVFDYGKTINLSNTDIPEEDYYSPRTASSKPQPKQSKSYHEQEEVVKSESVVQRSKVASPGGSNGSRRELPKLEKRDSKGAIPSAQVNGEGSPRKSKSTAKDKVSSSKADREDVHRSKSGDLKHSKDENRSSTRQIARSKDGIVDLPVIDSSDNSEGEEDRYMKGKAGGRGAKYPPKMDENDLSPRSVKSKADRIKSGMRNETAASLKERDKPKESASEPRQRHRQKKERKSKMAACLSGASSLDSSASTSMSMSNSVDPGKGGKVNGEKARSSQKGSVMLKKEGSSGSENGEIPPHSSDQQDSPTKPTSSKPQEPAVGKPRELPRLEQKQVSAVKRLEAVDMPARPGSGLGMSDDESMLQQIRNLNVKEKSESKSKGVPLWLQEDASSESPRESSRAKKSASDGNILDNWPQAGVSHLKTVLDEDKPESPATNVRRVNSTPNTSHKPHTPDHQPSAPVSSAKKSSSDPKLTLDLEVAEEEDDDEFDLEKEVEAEMSRMQQIESARKQWREKEEMKLEESWSSLNIFNKLHKGRISLDVEEDILDEYLNSERGGSKSRKPATIQEEEEGEEWGEEGGELGQENSKQVPTAANGGDFEIPELPQGRDMMVNIKSTWGDRHYVGLNGIEVFTSTGEIAKVAKIRAEPSDINVLDEYSKDPRVVGNLVDGVNRTRDDIHMWLAPYTKGKTHQVFITFEEPVQIAMMRIWNYNKSRIHSYRGAKDIEIMLDGKEIFHGEIARACGGIIGSTDAFGDTILFTMEEEILENVSQYDLALEADLQLEDQINQEEGGQDRPSTADDGERQVSSETRPFTAAANQRRVPEVAPAKVAVDGDCLVFRGQTLKLNFTCTWGDVYYLGLTGLEVVDKDGEAIPLNMNMLDADPRDLHILPGYERDDRTLDKLVDGMNITMSDEHMWLVPFTEGEDHVLNINFPKPVEMTGLRIWNYNKSAECTYRGAKVVHVCLDGRQVSPQDGFLIRKGPGNCFFDFAQEISFTEPCTPRVTPVHKEPPRPGQSMAEESSQEYEVLEKPCGFIYQLQLLSTWGDQYYVGLNGLEFYDGAGNLIQLTDNNISAHPESVNVLPSVQNDVRTPDKLIDGVYDTTDGSRMWLAPILPGTLNRVYVIFDHPMEISMIKLWNYSKTANRGVKDFALLVDDLLVYNGTLDMVQSRGIIPTVQGSQSHHTILFTNDKDIRRKEKHAIIRKQAGEQDVQLMNDCKVMTQKKTQQSKPVDQALRPKTSVTRPHRK